MKKLIISIIFISIIVLLAACRGEPNLVNSPEDVEGKIIGGMAGTPSIRLASELGSARAFESEESMINALREGSIACIIMERTTATELVSNSSGVRILSEPLMEYELRFAVPKENAGLLIAVNEALEELGRNGTLRGLYNKYFLGRNFTYTRLEDSAPRSGILTVALPPDSPPLSFKDSDGKFVGMDVEVAIAVGDFLGVELKPLEYDAWELATAVLLGSADLALGWHPSEGEGIVNMSEPYARVVQVVIVRR